mgnify:CR=1 FL=1|jgi:hypothetical protein
MRPRQNTYAQARFVSARLSQNPPYFSIKSMRCASFRGE